MSHTEQLTFFLRYALLKNRNGEVLERFLTLNDYEKKKGKDIAEAICDVLGKYQIDINRCRGQGYDNGSNMSGCYKEAQVIILEKNPQALYAPCGAHSFNLCGVHAVEASSEIKSFFGNIQKFTTYFLEVLLVGKFLKKLLAFLYIVYPKQDGVQELMQ